MKQSTQSVQTSEEFLRRVVASSPDCIKVLDLDGNLLSMNEGGQKVLEIADLTPHLGTCWTGWWQEGEARQAAQDAVQEALRGGMGRFEAFAQNFGGTPMWWDVTVSPILGADGRPEQLLSVSRDITRRKLAEQEATKLSEQRRLALDSARMGWWHLDLASGRLDMDERFQAIFDVDQESDAYTQVLRRIHPEDRNGVDAAVQSSLRPVDPTPYATEYRVVHRDGSIRWVAAKGQAYYDGEGSQKQAVSLSGTVIDVTGEKGAQDALRESETLRRIALEGGRMGTWRWNLRERTVWGDAVFLALWGLPFSTKPYPLSAYLKHLSAEGVAGVEAVTSKGTAPGEEFDGELQIVTGPAAGQWARWRGQADRETPWIINGVSFDVTESKLVQEALRESGERFRLLADSMPQMVWSTLPDGFHDYYNARWYEFTGVPSGSTDGEGWNGMFHPEDQERAWATWRHSLATGEPYQIEYRLRYRDGSYRWVLGRALAMSDEHGAIVRWFGTCTDIHESRLLREQNAQLLESERLARVEAERTGRLKDEFLATLSHELRTPLNAILGWTQVLREDPGHSEDTAAGLATIERNATAQTQIIEDLLDMSKIISGKVRLDVQPLQLDQVVTAAVDTMRPAATAKGVHLQSLIDPQARMISGDPNRLQQVFWNLLTNALKFTPKGGKVQVILERVDSHLEVCVADTGEGISPEFLPYVFDRFRQQDASTTRKHGGLGLGLAIVKQLVELHGGSISVESAGQGCGTTFCVKLPLSVVQPTAEQTNAERRHPQDGGGTLSVPAELLNLAGTKVLVVDDEADARALVRRLLEDRRAIVYTAGSAAEAWQLLQTERPDVLVSDVGMPEEDGYSLIRRVRALKEEEGGNTPAIALTAYARAEDRLKAILAGFQMHATKPVNAVELLALVASLAGRTRS